jgi:selenocysteine lyase/cysteine desulfurase
LYETRGIKTLVQEVDELSDTDRLISGIIGEITPHTKLILVSELDCFTGQKHDLSRLVDHAQKRGIPLLVDGAHSAGQIVCDPARYLMWVTSGHKWLGGPDGTGIVYVAPHLVPQLEPVWLGDKHFERKDADINDLRRFESQGTGDVVRWHGLTAAINLQLRIGAHTIYEREKELVTYLYDRLRDLRPTFRRTLQMDDPKSAMMAFHWPENRLRVPDLKEALWQRHKIWVQPDFINVKPGTGMRVSCHYSLHEDDLDRFVVALKELINV